MNILLVSGLFSAAESYGKGTAMTEIIIMLLVAFILGYLLRYLLSKDNDDKGDWENKYYNLKQQYDKLKVELDNCKKSKQAVGIASMPAKQKPSKKDDLKKIEGIGPKIEQLLYDAGIYSWRDLANTDVSVIEGILEKAGKRYQMHNPESWPFQAKMAADGKWDELNKWQDEHKGGRF
jgi:predicted flap endonuclease-1-like 5' DNA nuclease